MKGKRFGRLVAIEKVSTLHCRWLFQCDCGTKTIVRKFHAESGATRSCGCLKREEMLKRFTTHGMSHTTEHDIWLNMRNRCENPDNDAYKDYGGRGITVCERWQKFESFYADMGPRPKGRTLDRINNDLGYSRENCRWATWIQQANNRRPPKKRHAATPERKAAASR